MSKRDILYLLSKTIGSLNTNWRKNSYLTYHQFDTNDRYSISFDFFKDQIEYLVSSGYSFSNIKDNEYKTCKKRICITIDDGHPSSYKAIEYLVKRKIPVTLFLVSEFYLKNKKDSTLTVSILNTFPKELLEIGCHSFSHSNLKYSQDLYTEIYTSKRILEDTFKITIESFAIPYGTKKSFNDEILDFIYKSGYRLCCTQVPGEFYEYNNLQIVPRIGLNSTDNMKTFIQKVNGNYEFTKILK